MNHKIIIKKARLSLINKLKKVDIDSLNISDYNKRYFGSLIWNGIDYTVGNLNDIPNHVEVLEGDTVVTSGYSSIFPDEIIIGFVKSIEKQPGEPYYTIQVQFSEDIKKVAQVYVVNNLFKEEKQNIENSADNSLDDQ